MANLCQAVGHCIPWVHLRTFLNKTIVTIVVFTHACTDHLSLGCFPHFTPQQVQKCRKLFSLAIWRHEDDDQKPPFGPCISLCEKVPQTAANVKGAPVFEAIKLVNVNGTQWEVEDRAHSVLPNTVIIDFSLGSESTDKSKSNLTNENNSNPLTSLAKQEEFNATATAASKKSPEIKVEHHVTSASQSIHEGFEMLTKDRIDSVNGKQFKFKGEFSSPTGDCRAFIDVSFDRTEHIFALTLHCEEHPTWTSDLCCPCWCILEMDRHIKN